MELESSPKSQNQSVMVPVEVSVKLTVSDACPDVGVAEKLASGGPEALVTVMTLEAELAPAAPVTVRNAVKVPAVV